MSSTNSDLLTQQPMQPKPKKYSFGDTETAMRTWYGIDGILGLGHNWNIVSIERLGSTFIEIGPEVHKYSELSKYKGIAALAAFKEILCLPLGNIFSLNIEILFCSKTKRKRLLKAQLKQIRDLIVSAMESSILRLPDDSETKKSFQVVKTEYRINNQKDWEILGCYLVEEIKNMIHKAEVKLEKELEKLIQENKFKSPEGKEKLIQEAKVKSPEELLVNNKVFFVMHLFGQEQNIPDYYEHRNCDSDSDTREQDWWIVYHMNNNYFVVRPENLIELAIHCAKDFTPTNGNHTMPIPNSAKIENLLGRPAEYYPFLAVPGLGNVNYRFDNNIHGSIKALKVYQRWTNYTKHDIRNYYRRPYIARRLFELMAIRFKVNIVNHKEFVRKVRLGKDKQIIFKKIIKEVKELLEVLEAGVEVRIEVIWSSSFIQNEIDIGTIIKTAFRETDKWLKDHSLFYLHCKFTDYITQINTQVVMGWAEHFISPSINTIERAIKKLDQALHAESILAVETKSYYTSQEYQDLMAAETIISFFLMGCLQEKTEDNFWIDEKINYFGLGLSRNDAKQNFILRNIKIENGYVSCKLNNHWFVPAWVQWPENAFLMEIRRHMESVSSLDNNEKETLDMQEMYRAIIGYVIAYEKDDKNKNSNITFSKKKLDLETMYEKSRMPQPTGPLRVVSADRLGRPELKRKILDFIDLSDLVKKVFITSQNKKEVITCILGVINKFLKDECSRDLEKELDQFMEKEVLSQSFPFIFSTGPYGHIFVGIPHKQFDGSQKKEREEYQSLFSSTYLLYCKINRSDKSKLTSTVEKLLVHWEQIRLNFEVQEFLKLCELMIDNKLKEVEYLIQGNDKCDRSPSNLKRLLSFKCHV